MQPVELYTKRGLRGRIKEPVGTHGMLVMLETFTIDFTINILTASYFREKQIVCCSVKYVHVHPWLFLWPIVLRWGLGIDERYLNLTKLMITNELLLWDKVYYSFSGWSIVYFHFIFLLVLPMSIQIYVGYMIFDHILYLFLLRNNEVPSQRGSWTAGYCMYEFI